MPSLNWIGKGDVEKHVREIPTRLLQCDRDLSFGSGLTNEATLEFSPARGNLLIEGDNLLALKALLPFYKNQVKCITIDPPYNTGNEGWIYNDNVNSPQIRAWLGKTVDGEDLCRHDKWLCMMRPRLEFHQQLLREDGVIFVSIDDNEVHHLRALCDEVFGASNFIAQIVWQKADSPSSNSPNLTLASYHDHLIIYAKNKPLLTLNRLEKPEILEAYPKVNPDGLRYRERLLRKNGKSSSQEDRKTMHFPIPDPDGADVWPINPKDGSKGRWAVGEKGYLKLKEQGNLVWRKREGQWTPYSLEWAPPEPTVASPTIWGPTFGVEQNRQAKAELNDILGENHGFDTPKPVSLIERILQIATNPGDIILDSFAGSGTTAHAVLKLNAQNPEAASRRFVLVEMEPQIARPITRERIARAIGGYGKHLPLPGDFRFCHLGEPILDAQGGVNQRASWRDLAHFFYLDRFQTAPDMAQLDPQTGFVGKAGGVSLYLLFDSKGIAPLDAPAWKKLMAVPGSKMVYCESVGVPAALLERAQIATFVVPYEVAF